MRGGRIRQGDEASAPLLEQEDTLHNGQVVFSLDEDDEDTPLGDREQILSTAWQSAPLRSTIQSRETEYEQDTDDIDDALDAELPTTGSSDRRTRNMPLLVGLMHSSSRRSLDLPLNNLNGFQNSAERSAYLDDLAAKRLAGGGLLDSIANMANSILGAGIIGLPYAIREAGFVSGVLLLIALCGVTDWTIRLIVINAKLSGSSSYIGIMDHCFGPSGRAAVSFFQFAFAFGGMCAFGIIIGDTIPHVIRSIFPKLASVPVLWVFTNRNFIVVLCTVGVSYPLSLYRDISKLARASGFALIGMLVIVTSVWIEGGRVSSDLKGDPTERFSFLRPQIFEAIGVISFAFVCHHNSLLIYGSMQTPTLDRFKAVTHISTGLSLLFCMLLGVSAFLVFTDKTQGNILNNFAPDDTLINIARFCFGLNMFTTLPLELFVCREVIEQYFFEHEPFDHHRHVILTTVILFGSMLLSLVTCDLGVMLEITGGVSATALAYIFPAICYFKLSKNVKWVSGPRLGAIACATFGAIVLVLSVILAMKNAWDSDGSTKTCV